MIRRPPRSTQSRSSAASDVYKRQTQRQDLARVVANRESSPALDRVKGDAPPAIGQLGGLARFEQQPQGFALGILELRHLLGAQCVDRLGPTLRIQLALIDAERQCRVLEV